ncbi:hypothetical protein C9374_008596 [Naegleria lovaniensis]|uniref:Uncharacterized protein n=1 Tax=Naegleria lovaniensis TaxID=51637 RepID=A0AA88GI83_NAELO|nr:uncharacterized protein C9374_008596 [Naegleria lovaniensis]KAG2377974.1 hypothetical protein C9374_008596 [Naegleria lovaniensis]
MFADDGVVLSPKQGSKERTASKSSPHSEEKGHQIQYEVPFQAPSVEEEMECLANICECLGSCLSNIKRYLNQLDDDLNMDFVDQALECFQLALTLLSSDPEPNRLKHLVFGSSQNEDFSEQSIISLLLDYIALPSYFRPSALNEFSMDQSAQTEIANEIDQLLNHLKVYALKCLSKLISICSFESRNLYMETLGESVIKSLSKLCAESIVQDHGVEIMLDYLSSSDQIREPSDPSLVGNAIENEELRLAVAECLFFFVVRNEVGRLAVLIQRGIPRFLKCLEQEPNQLIRCYCCAILREFSSSFPEEMLKDNAIQVCVKVLNADPSLEVRALCAELLEVLFKTEPKAFQFVSVPTLCKVLNDRLQKETSRDVLEATCKLLETLFTSNLAGSNDPVLLVHEEFIQKGYWKSFIRVLKQCSPRPASLATRAFRYLLQFAPSDQRLAREVVSHFQSLSILLKACLESTKTNEQKQLSSTNVANKLLKVELSIIMALLFVQSPFSRNQIHNELKAFPLWMSTLRGALLKHLGFAEMDYFSDLKIIDENGRNVIAAFAAKSSLQLNSDILKEIFEAQESENIYFDDTNSTGIANEHDGKINHFILSFALHTTLTVKEPHVTSNISSPSRITKTPSKTPSKTSSRILETEPSYMSSDTSFTPRQKTTNESSFNTSMNSDDSFIQQFGKVLTKHEVIEIEEHSASDSSSFSKKELSNSPKTSLPSPSSARRSSQQALAFTSNSSFENTVFPESLINARSIVSRASVNKALQKKEFDNSVFLCKVFGVWYESHEMKIERQKAQDSFVKAHRMAANTTGLKIIPTGFVNTPDGLVLRYQPNESPQKLTKHWTDEDVKLSDVFTFEVPFDDFTVERVERVHQALARHCKLVKKLLVCCPKSPKNRRTFLMDMNLNIMPKSNQIIEELLLLMKEYGVENIKMPIYLWKGKERKDTSLTQYNILEILEFVKIHIANHCQLPIDNPNVETKV